MNDLTNRRVVCVGVVRGSKGAGWRRHRNRRTTCLRKYGDFKGRASRSEFWWFLLFYYAALFLPLIIVTAIPRGVQDDLSPVAGALIVFAFLALVLPYLAATVRRLHDTSKSGWWWFIALIPFGSIILIVFLASAGSPGWNQFGPPPGTEPLPTLPPSAIPPPPPPPPPT